MLRNFSSHSQSYLRCCSPSTPTPRTYLADEPVAKIIHWKGYDGATMATTKLELVLQKVVDAIGASLVEVKYYDFTAPQANKLLIIADREDEDSIIDSFDILIPNDITVDKRSWSLYGLSVDPATLNIDNDKIGSFGSVGGDAWQHGRLTPNQLRTGVFHTVSVRHDERFSDGIDGWTAGAIVLVYQQP